jgi:hypothetical protein
MFKVIPFLLEVNDVTYWRGLPWTSETEAYFDAECIADASGYSFSVIDYLSRFQSWRLVVTIEGNTSAAAYNPALSEAFLDRKAKQYSAPLAAYPQSGEHTAQEELEAVLDEPDFWPEGWEPGSR